MLFLKRLRGLLLKSGKGHLGATCEPCDLRPQQGEPFPRLTEERHSSKQPCSTSSVECPRCGPGTVVENTITGKVAVDIGPRNRIERPVTVTSLVCKECDLVLNDDCRGAVAQAYASIFRQCREPAIPRYEDVVQKAQELLVSTELDIRTDWLQVQDSWSAIRIAVVAAGDLEKAIGLIFAGNVAHGFSQITNEVMDGKTLQINAIHPSLSSWNPYRVRKMADGSFAFYGHVSLYRFISTLST